MQKTMCFKKSKLFFKITIYSFLIIILSALSTACHAQDGIKNKPLDPTQSKKTEISESVPKNRVDSPSSAFVQYAQSAGVRKCLGRIEQVVTFLTGDISTVGGHFFIPSPDPDNMMVSLSMEIQQPGNILAYASSSFAPNQVNGCGGIYETVVYWPQKSELVAQQQYSDLHRVGKLSSQIIVLDGGSTLRIFLMPAGTGCIAIKKELIQ
ncbi:hypothetical protein SAMN04488082_111105 [Desulfomicrobium apsheronum]|uniref:Lipoprotein n=1 Tax=Desulfomicrobium apsheronum TaxID=52560 RepID=A0A1I3W1H7_9BACT|nr:hypothetical protein [Desulfomicrobium apsheronum]SFK00281.1 hypothetical protein SAMN04488082_111105 [Desulfomicrobium apsheronum]